MRLLAMFVILARGLVPSDEGVAQPPSPLMRASVARPFEPPPRRAWPVTGAPPASPANPVLAAGRGWSASTIPQAADHRRAGH
jgi:hypothetical protein